MTIRNPLANTPFPIAPANIDRRQKYILPACEELGYRSHMALPRRNDELDDFKSQINLCEYMSSRGFTLDRKLSSRSSAVMRKDADKLIVARGANRHWKYFNVHDDRDKGTIIDFVQFRDPISLGEIRKELRPWVGRNGPVIACVRQPFAELVPSEHDAVRVITKWEMSKSINGSHDYLERERRIPSLVLSDPIFADRIRIDHRGNALFAHHNPDGLCGYEIKNRGFTGFAPGGIKGFFCSRPRPNDHELVICETAIDALSFATLFGTERKRFLSTSGQVSQTQKVMLQSAASKMPIGSSIIVATDNDKAGRKLAETITEAIQEVDLDNKEIIFRLPRDENEDWNDVLRRSGRCKLVFPSLG